MDNCLKNGFYYTSLGRNKTICIKYALVLPLRDQCSRHYDPYVGLVAKELAAGVLKAPVALVRAR